MDRERLYHIIDLVIECDRLWYPKVQVDITTTGHVIVVHIWDSRSNDKTISIYYETKIDYSNEEYIRNGDIRTILDPNLEKAERYLMAIIKDGEKNVHP